MDVRARAYCISLKLVPLRPRRLNIERSFPPNDVPANRYLLFDYRIVERDLARAAKSFIRRSRARTRLLRRGQSNRSIFLVLQPLEYFRFVHTRRARQRRWNTGDYSDYTSRGVQGRVPCLVLNMFDSKLCLPGFRHSRVSR